ncbi:hypothetical protein [Roseateles flavus]|uniref:Uncharacterized protein n=1 Tax=Roseateles flavus TaxID=3149041 RepID=A0ABV0G885_9BURK
MHVETLTLERVFDVQRPTIGRSRDTTSDFSFEAQGRKVYGLNAPGTPSLKAGDRVSFVLRESGNFQSLVGWHNHTTGEDVLPRHRSLGRGLFHAGVILVFGWMMFSTAEQPGVRLMTGGLLALFVLIAISTVQNAWQGQQAARVIRSLRESAEGR